MKAVQNVENLKNSKCVLSFHISNSKCYLQDACCSFQVRDVRLPRHLKPELYKIELLPFIIPDNFTIRGRLELTMSCHIEVSKNVTLHVADMTLDNDTITLIDMSTGKNIPIVKHSYDLDREFYIAHLGQTLKPGNEYVIKIDYVANLNDNLKGFYRSVYKNLKTKEDE